MTANRNVIVLVLVGLLAVVTCIAVLYAAWYLEESRKAVRTVVVESSDGDDVFVVEMQRKPGGDYIVHCDEEDFQDAFRHFRNFAQIENAPIRVPGGPMVLSLAEVELPEKLRPAQRATIELLRRHAPRRIVLVAHTECLLYDTIAAWQDDLENVKQRQHRDMVAAARAIRQWFPDAEVELYLADKQGDRLKFLPMSPTIEPWLDDIITTPEVEGDPAMGG